MLFADVDIGGKAAFVDDRGHSCGTSAGLHGVRA